MSDIKVAWVQGSEIVLGYYSEAAHDSLREFFNTNKIDAAFTYDTSSALYSGIVYVHDISDRDLMLLKLMI